MPCVEPPAIYCQMPDNPGYGYGIEVPRCVSDNASRAEPVFVKAFLRAPFFRPKLGDVEDRHVCKITINDEDDRQADASVYYRYGNNCVSKPPRKYTKCGVDR